MSEELLELTSRVLAYMRANTLVSAPILHGTAGANFAVTARITASMLLGNTENEIMGDLVASYRPETANRFYNSAKIQYEKIKRNSPDEFASYFVNGAKNVTPKKKRLPKPRKALSSDMPSLHVNKDGSIVEMKDELKKEEETFSTDGSVTV